MQALTAVELHHTQAEDASHSDKIEVDEHVVSSGNVTNEPIVDC